MRQAVVIVPVRDAAVAAGAPEAICEALDLVGDSHGVRVLCVGSGAEVAAHDLGELGFADVPREWAEAGVFAPGRWAAALSAMIDPRVRWVILAASVDGRDLAPRLAARLGRPLQAGVLAIRSDRVLLPRASGRALVEVPVVEPAVVTLQVGVRGSTRVPSADPTTPVTMADFVLPDNVVDAEVLGVDPPRAHTMDLTEAPFIVGAGIGLGSEKVIDELGEVAAELGASVGATRVVTDEGWMGHDRQIGTTGVVVDPRIYVAFGISGAVQHTSGLGAPDHVISVNTDAHCPMMQMADLAIVADAPGVVAALHRRLGAAGRQRETTEGS